MREVRESHDCDSAAAMSRAVRESHDCDSAVRVRINVRINVRFLAESPPPK